MAKKRPKKPAKRKLRVKKAPISDLEPKKKDAKGGLTLNTQLSPQFAPLSPQFAPPYVPVMPRY